MKKYFVKPNEAVNVAYLKEKGYDSVYLCASKGFEKDPAFEGNYKAALLAGLKIGLYHYYECVHRDNKYTASSGKEGKVFAEAIKDKVYALPLGLFFRSGVRFDKEDWSGSVNAIRNGINGFAQYVDKEKVWKSKNLKIFANAEQMEFIKGDPDNRVYSLEVVD